MPFETQPLFDAWEKFALQSRPSFSFDGRRDPKPSRNCGPCREELEKTGEPLYELALLCPNGYLAIANLKTVLVQLHQKYDVLAPTAEEIEKGIVDGFQKVHTSADIWKIMLKHSLLLRGSKVGGKLQPVIDALKPLPGDSPDQADSGFRTPDGKVPVDSNGFADFSSFDGFEGAGGPAVDHHDVLAGDVATSQVVA